ncbi:MAG TPA: cobalt-precorrin-5B (C(1))-methyltransferase CbiD, partial [Armatimonadota bacterium]
MTETLRAGFTTGTCAAAAAKAAALCLRGEECRAVELCFPAGDTEILAIENVERLSPSSARATVIKDAGDDPDITDGMSVVTTIELTGEGITFYAGEGVGTVTSPGLQLPPGEPAINPVPREMIAQALRDVLGDAGCRVTVSIPGGEAAAAKTFNPRLGITGGLSILGTSGRVMPKSEDAWLRSLIPQIDVALAAGYRQLFLTPGGFGEKAAIEKLGAELPAVIQTSNF